MIARIWEGRVPSDKCEAYLRLMREIAIPDYQRTNGNLAAWCLWADEQETTLVKMVTLWVDENAIRQFAGPDILAAKYYEFDREYLIEMSQNVVHYQAYAG